VEEQKIEEQKVERQIITIDGKHYYSDSLSTDAKNLIQASQIIDAQIKDYKLKIEISDIAKNSLLSKLKAMLNTFEEVPEEKDVSEKSGEALK